MALGGGGALIAHGLVERDSEDLDAFVDSREDFRCVAGRVRAAFLRANYEISDHDNLGDPDQIVTWFVSPRKASTRGRPTMPLKIQLLRAPILLDPGVTGTGQPGSTVPPIASTRLGEKAAVTTISGDFGDLVVVRRVGEDPQCPELLTARWGDTAEDVPLAGLRRQ